MSAVKPILSPANHGLINYASMVQYFVDQLVNQFAARSKIPGIAVAISISNQIWHAEAGVVSVASEHPFGVGSRFPSGGIAKFLTSLAALKLVSQGGLTLDIPIARYLPELRGGPGERIALRHLLSHSAGYQGENLADPDIRMNYSWEEFIASFRSRSFLFEPGSVFDYSHSASVIVGELITEVTGKNVETYVRETILAPLGIVTSQTEVADIVSAHIMNPQSQTFVPIPAWDGCDFWSASLAGPSLTVSELVTLGQALVVADKFPDQLILNHLYTPCVTLPTLTRGVGHQKMPIAYGMGCAHYGNGLYGVVANNPGQTLALRIDPTRQIIAAVGINASHGALCDYLLDQLMRPRLLPVPEPASVLASISDDTFELSELVGTFQGAQHHTFESTLQGEQLILKPGHNPATPRNPNHPGFAWIKNQDGKIVPEIADQMVAKSAPHPMSFFRDPISATPCLMVGLNAYKKVAT